MYIQLNTETNFISSFGMPFYDLCFPVLFIHRRLLDFIEYSIVFVFSKGDPFKMVAPVQKR